MIRIAWERLDAHNLADLRDKVDFPNLELEDLCVNNPPQKIAQVIEILVKIFYKISTEKIFSRDGRAPSEATAAAPRLLLDLAQRKGEAAAP